MSAAVLDLEGVRRRELRRTAIVSSLAHLLLVTAFLASPQLRSRSLVGPSVVTVDLVAPPPRAAPPSPAPPAPRPRTVARRVPSRVVLPAEPTRTLPETPPEAEAPAEPEPRPEPLEESYEELLERLRTERGEIEPEAREVASLHPETLAPEPAPVPAPPAAATGTATGGGVPAPPEVVAWLRDARVHVRRVWVLPQAMRFQALETRVEVELDAAGRVLGEPEVTERSGNPWYDESVVRAIEKASPLPAPPEAGRWPFVFRPEDL